MSRVINHPETVRPTMNGTFNPNSELEEHCYQAVQNLLHENDALFKKHEPSSISLQIRRGTDNKLSVGASASVRIRIYASSISPVIPDPKRWDEETKFDLK